MNSLKHWLHAHPFKAVAFSVLITAVSTFIGCNDHLFNYGAALVGLLALTLGAMLWRDTRKAVTILVLLSFVTFVTPSRSETPPPQDQAASPVAVGAAVVVVCVGSYCIYKLAKFCQKKFPKESTNSAGANFAASAEEEYGASWNYGAMGSCYEGDADDMLRAASWEPAEDGTLFTINSLLNEDSTLTTSMGVARGSAVTQSFEDFAAEVRSHGLHISGIGDGSQYFSRNRTPVPPGTVPIAFDPQTKTVSVVTGGGEVRRVTVERSKDLVTWQPFLSVNVETGRGFQVQDATRAGQMFYRLAVSSP